MSRCCYAILILLYSGTTVLADDVAVYESISDVAIGRVFLSPQQRQQLDVRRLHPERYESANVSPGSEPRPMKHKSTPAGYIISNSGKSRYWNNGDFVAGSGRFVATMSFPGDIAVVRHVAADATIQETSGKNDAERQTTARPDARENPSAEGEAGADEK